MIQNRFEDQCAGVTGGGSGIGRAIARLIMASCLKPKVALGRLVAIVAGFWTASVFDLSGGRATC